MTKTVQSIRFVGEYRIAEILYQQTVTTPEGDTIALNQREVLRPGDDLAHVPGADRAMIDAAWTPGVRSAYAAFAEAQRAATATPAAG